MNLRKAFVVAKSVGKFGGVTIENIPALTKIPDTHVAVHMKASRINPADMDIASGLPFGSPVKKDYEEHNLAGVDGSGTISKVGSAVKDLNVGDNVFIYRQFTDIGTWAEEVCVPAKFVAKVPKSLSLEDIGALSLTAPTAYDSLFNTLKVQRGQSILILGAGGGVGFSAVQFAVHAGLTVFAYASRRDFDKLEKVGVKRCIDYRSESLESVLKPGDVDLVFDAAGKSSLSQLCRDLQPKKLCSIKHPNSEAMPGIGIELGWFWKTLLSLISFKDNRAARKSGVELLGQVTPAGHPTLLNSVAKRIDEIGGDKFQVSYTTISLGEIESAGGLTEKDVGKVILFQ